MADPDDPLLGSARAQANPPGGGTGSLSTDALRDASVVGAKSFAKWRVVYEFSAIAALLALTRMIPPAEIGHAAIALILPVMAGIIAFEGFAGGLVIRSSVGPAHHRTSTLLSLTGGAVLTAGTAAVAWFVLPSLFGTKTAHLVALMSPVFLVAAAGADSRVVLQRRLDFARLSRYEAIGFVTGSVIAVGLAIAGVDAPAPVIGQLSAVVVESALIIAASPPARPGFDRTAMRDILGYGISAAAAGILYAVRRNADYIVLGAMSTPSQVGLYYRAFQIGGEYQGKLTGILQRILFPILARAGSDADRRWLRSRIVTINSVAVCPLLTLLLIGAPALVPLLFGETWAAAADPARALAVAGIALSLMSGADIYVLALGRSQSVLRFNGVFLIAVIGTVAALASEGIVAVSIGVAAVHVVMMVVGQVWLLGRIGGIPFRQFVRDSAPALVSSGALAVVTFPVYAAVYPNLPDPVTVLIIGAVGLVTYAATLRILFPRTWSLVTVAIMALLRRTRPVEPAPAATRTRA